MWKMISNVEFSFYIFYSLKNRHLRTKGKKKLKEDIKSGLFILNIMFIKRWGK